MKKLMLILILGSAINLQAQERFMTRSGTIQFEASVPSFEPVAAKNNSVTAILDPKNGNIAALVLVKGFRFENALMEEHFNENYAESFKYPKASLEGDLIDFSLEKISREPVMMSLNGQLTFHGETLPVEIPVYVSMEENILHLDADFILVPADFNIEIPRIVRDKVAKEVAVKVDFELVEE